MTNAVLTINAGSSSLKFSVYADEGGPMLARGVADRVGEMVGERAVDRGGNTAGTTGRLSLCDAQGRDIEVSNRSFATHEQALAAVLESVARVFPACRIRGVGHRIVHGGTEYAEPVVVDATVLEHLEQFVPLAPLHQPHNLDGVRASIKAFGDAVQVACFDTAFHRSHPFVNDTFALPREYYQKGIRRYGFHGLSYAFIAAELARQAPSLAAGRVVVAHLGNGASMCAMLNGKSVASTMGFSALDGLPMGTRCGQLDPGVILYLLEKENLDVPALSDLLYRRSGLLGLSGLSHDMRVLEASSDPAAAEAIDYFVFRIQRELGAMAAALGGIDALVFCGGIGEHSKLVRDRVCQRMAWMGIELDRERNNSDAMVISSDLSRTTVLVIPTDEERVIAQAVWRVLGWTEPAQVTQ